MVRPAAHKSQKRSRAANEQLRISETSGCEGHPCRWLDPAAPPSCSRQAIASIEISTPGPKGSNVIAQAAGARR